MKYTAAIYKSEDIYIGISPEVEGVITTDTTPEGILPKLSRRIQQMREIKEALLKDYPTHQLHSTKTFTT